MRPEAAGLAEIPRGLRGRQLIGSRAAARRTERLRQRVVGRFARSAFASRFPKAASTYKAREPRSRIAEVGVGGGRLRCRSARAT